MLLFDVENQVITRRDRFSPATDSVKYLKAKFNFKTDDWSDKSKTAVFTVFDKQYPAVIDSNNVCLIPWEALAYTVENNYRFAVDNYIYVSAVGIKGDIRITTDKVKILLNLSGYGEWENTSEPTPDVYTQYVNMIKAEAEAVAQALDETEAINEEIKNSYSNAFKGSASGYGVRVDDVSPVEHTVKVSCNGHNLFNGDMVDGIYLSNSFSIDVQTNYKSLKCYLKKGTYTISVSERVYIARRIIDGVYCIIAVDGTSYTFTVERDGYVGFSLRLNPSTEWRDDVTIQIEKGDVATEYVPYEDPTSVTVNRYGKNLFNPLAVPSDTLHGITAKYEGSGVFHIYGTYDASNLDGAVGLCHINVPCNPEDYFTASTVLLSGTLNKHFYSYFGVGEIMSTRTNWNAVRIDSDTPIGSTVSLTSQPKRDGMNIKYITSFWFYIPASTEAYSIDCRVKVQLERGETATDFEEYIAPETYVPNEDGSVDGVKSLSPTMTLLTDNANAIIELEYNRDVNNVIGDVESALDSIIEIQNSLIGGVG